MNLNNNEMELDGILPPTNTPLWNPMNGSPLMAPNIDLFMNRRRGSSNISWKSNRSFTVTPLNINQKHSLPKSAYNPSSLSTVSSIDTTKCDTQDFVRSAPVYGDVNTWDQAITSWKSPTLDGAMDLDTITGEDNDEQIPEFMKSNFFMPDSDLPFSRRTSVESMASLLNPSQPAPQSAPPSSYDFVEIQQQMFGNDKWSGMVTSAFGPPQIPPHTSSITKEPASLTISESDIFGGCDNNNNNNNNNNKTRNRNWSNFTTESENEPIINLAKLSGTKRSRNKSMSEGDLKYMPPQQRVRINGNHEIPPPIYNNNNNNNNNNNLPPLIPTLHTQPRKRGRPRKYPLNNNKKPKKPSKYAGLKKSEREKLRRKELKEGYQTLTQLLDLTVERSGAALPDRSLIVSKACDEIKRLENKLFTLSMENKWANRGPTNT